jgi:hypothetical protein
VPRRPRRSRIRARLTPTKPPRRRRHIVHRRRARAHRGRAGCGVEERSRGRSPGSLKPASPSNKSRSGDRRRRDHAAPNTAAVVGECRTISAATSRASNPVGGDCDRRSRDVPTMPASAPQLGCSARRPQASVDQGSTPARSSPLSRGTGVHLVTRGRRERLARATPGRRAARRREPAQSPAPSASAASRISEDAARRAARLAHHGTGSVNRLSPRRAYLLQHAGNRWTGTRGARRP